MWFLSRPQWREVAVIGLPVALLVGAAFALAYQFVEPAPPRRIVMTTGSEQGAYHAFGKRYAAALAKSGIALEVRSSAGSLQNIERLVDAKSGVQIGFVQGGLAHGTSHPELSSLGRTFLEPLWVFHRAGLTLDRLAELAGRTIAVGPSGSGTRALATKLLAASGVSEQTATFVSGGTAEASLLLAEGKIDAAFFAVAAESEVIGKLLRNPSVRLMSFAQADALTRLYPFLAKVVLPAGVVDLASDVPPHDVTLLAAAGALVVRQDVHPAIVRLLVEAAREIHGGAGLFQRPGEFPQSVDTELPVDPDAARYYKNGPPFLERYLPFWLAVFLERMGIMLVPVATILLPLFKVVPMAYNWRVKRRILFWYDKLKGLERRFKADCSREKLDQYRDEIHRIEDAVSVIPMPLGYSDQLYNLRSAVELVRQRIAVLPTNAAA